MQWSHQVEKAVHAALLEVQQDMLPTSGFAGLPPNCRGRCQPFEPKKTHVTGLIPQARQGEFAPIVDQPTHLIKNLTIQVRRIHSLRRRCGANKPQPALVLQQEWQCILRAKGCKQHFWDWLFTMPELYPVPLSTPVEAYLFDMGQLLEHHVNQLVYQHNKRRDQLSAFLRDRDVKRFGKKQAFQSIREPSHGLVDQIQQTIQYRVPVSVPLQHGLVTVDLPSNHTLLSHLPCTIDDQLAEVVSLNESHLELMLQDADAVLADTFILSQLQHWVEPPKVATLMNDYWLRFWDQDQGVSDDRWDDFLSLLEHFPPQQPVPNSTADLETWKWAVKALNPATARGSCGWSASELQMLPVACIADLKAACDQMIPSGFPTFLMRARVVALCKKAGSFSPSDVRPITVLSLIYRLWSKVATRSVFLCWGDLFPPSVTGFLPKRSYTNALYALQLQLEKAAYGAGAQSPGGLTLDIQKAFNNVPTKPCRRLMLLLGVDPMLVDCWYTSLGRMKRSWQVQGQLFEQLPTATGVPEGDQWSVLSMLAINRALVYLVELQCPSVILHLFADNWSFHAASSQAHSSMMLLLQDFTQKLHIPIDWQKTFCWATSDEHADEWTRLRNLYPFAHDLQHVSNSRELGIIMHYRCRMTRDTQQERHDLALQRLRKLQHLQVDYKVKGEIIQAACINKALYGTHAYATGASFFKELRTEIKSAFLGSKANAQPHLSCMILTSSLQDPEQYVISQAVIHARMYLSVASDAEALEFYNLVASVDRPPQSIMGPAGALSFYLAKLSWQLDRQGWLLVDAFFRLHLLYSDLADILRAVEQAWLDLVALEVSSRQGCKHMPPLDRRLTTTVFSRMGSDGKHALALELTGAFMTGEQKHHFLDDGALCPFCSQVDSKEHQLLHCPATEVVRHTHADTCEMLDQHDLIYTLQPAVFQNSQFSYIRMLQFHLPEADLQVTQARYGFFTDGSCQQPTSPFHRWGAYAVVFPLHAVAEIVADVHLPLGMILDKHFGTAGVALLPGRQSIDRAELLAAVQTHEQRTEQPVHTDSAYVLSRYALLQQTRNIWVLHKMKNFDLLRRWHTLLWDHDLSTPTVKVKAHQDLLADSPRETWLRIGNAVADLVAKRACLQLLPSYTQLMRDGFTDEQHAQDFFHKQLLLRRDLALMRKQLLTQDDNVEQFNPSRTLQVYQNWDFTEGWHVAIDDDDLWITDYSRWGTPFTHLLLQWLGSLRFPSPALDHDCGVTWLELFFNFMLTTQTDVPLKVEGYYQPVASLLGWSREQFLINDAIVSFTGAIKHVEFLLQRDLLPKGRGVLISSLYKLGAGGHKMGLSQRPCMLLQDESMQWVWDYLHRSPDSKKTQFVELPTIPHREPIFSTVLLPPEGETLQMREERYVSWRRSRHRPS
eukprot:Skav210137  [mRNA]  locus=scaffold1493:168850:173052:- [translate_table: standard]